MIIARSARHRRREVGPPSLDGRDGDRCGAVCDTGHGPTHAASGGEVAGRARGRRGANHAGISRRCRPRGTGPRGAGPGSGRRARGAAPTAQGWNAVGCLRRASRARLGDRPARPRRGARGNRGGRPVPLRGLVPSPARPTSAAPARGIRGRDDAGAVQRDLALVAEGRAHPRAPIHRSLQARFAHQCLRTDESARSARPRSSDRNRYRGAPGQRGRALAHAAPASGRHPVHRRTRGGPRLVHGRSHPRGRGITRMLAR